MPAAGPAKLRPSGCSASAITTAAVLRLVDHPPGPDGQADDAAPRL